MKDDFNINRKPTGGERVVGIVCSSILVLLFGTITAISFSLFSPVSLLSLVPISFGLLTALGALVTYRFAFGQAKKPSPRSLKVANYVFVFFGLLMVGAFFLVDGVRPSFSLLGFGFLAVSIGLRNLLHAD